MANGKFYGTGRRKKSNRKSIFSTWNRKNYNK